jgi:hypothetical protein
LNPKNIELLGFNFWRQKLNTNSLFQFFIHIFLSLMLIGLILNLFLCSFI